MYNNLIQDDIIVLDNEFFKINMMFETVDRIYDIKMKELEYNYLYTENVDIEFVDLYMEAENAKTNKQQGLLSRMFTAILNFIRSIRAKILRLFGNDKKAKELEDKIKGDPKLANQTVEITNTVDAEKAIDEGTSFFGSLIDKIIGGKATEKDADEAEEKNKSLLSRIAIFGGGALLAAGGAKVANDKLHIIEKLGNLLKREEDTKKKSNEVTQTNEQNVQKGDQALKNNSQSGNEENTKAGRRIMSSFKDFITGAGKFFTGKASEIRSKINGVSSDEQQTTTSQARPKIVNYPEFSDATDNDKEKLIMDASKAIKTIPQNSERGKREKENLEKIISKGISINSGDYNTLVSVVRNGDISKKYKESNNKKNEQPKNKTDIQMDDEEASIRCKHIIEEIKIYDSTNHVLTKDEMQKINEIDKKVTNKKCNENDLNMVQKINDDMKKRTPDTSRNSNIFNHTNEAETEEPNSYCNRTIKEIETEPGEGAQLTDDEKKQINEIKDRLKNKKCTRNDAKILDRISDEQDKRRRALFKNDKQNQKNDNKQWNQSIDYRKDFAERLLEHESIDTIPTLKTELERIIKNGKYTDEEYKRMGEIEDRLQFEMILQKVYDDRDKLNSNDQKILDTLIKKINITANDDKELTILLNKVQDAKYNEKKRNKSNEQQTQTNKNDSENDTEQPEKSNNQQSLNNKANENNKNETSNSVNNSNTITTVENGKIVTKLRQEKCSYLSWNVPLKCFEEVSYKTDIIVDPSTNFAYINKIGPEFDIPLDVERAYGIKEKTHIDKTYKIKLAKYVPPPSSTVENIIKGKIYKDKPMKYESSSFNLIGNNSTLRKRGNIIMENTKVLNFIDELEQERRNEVDNNRFKDSISYKYNCLNNAKKDGVEECLSKSFEKFYLDAIPLNDEYKTANHDDLCNDVHDFIKKQGAKSMTYYVGEARKKSPVMKKLYESVEKLVDDKFKEKEEKINETKPELDLVFKMDGETEKKIDVINQDLELDDIAKVISDNVRNTAMSEINRAKEEKENMKQIETDLANDINVKSEAAIERELSLRGINQKSVFQPSLFEGIMIGKMNKLAYTTESTDDVYLYNAMKDYTGAFYEGGDSATPEEIAFVESVRELTLLSMERALKIKKYSLQDIKNLANEYASMK